MGTEDMWKPLTEVRDEMWQPLTTVRDSMWIGLGEAVTRYVRLLLQTVDNTYRLFTDDHTFWLKTKDKVSRLFTRKGGGV